MFGRVACRLFVLVSLFTTVTGRGAAPVIYGTPGYESPVLGGPDQLLFLGGSGFRADDRVVYEAEKEGLPTAGHPRELPSRSTSERGLASVVKLGKPPFSLTIRLPEVLAPDTLYRLWVVNAESQWSEPFTINDPRPLWFSPAYVYAKTDFADLKRRLRVIGRNLGSGVQTRPLQIRLQGPETYTLNASAPTPPQSAVTRYVAEISLPGFMVPGSYTVSVQRAGVSWINVPEQKLTVLPDPPELLRFTISDARFGSCRADDSADDSPCFTHALDAARAAGGGIVQIPDGTWDLYPTGAMGGGEFTLTYNVHLEGAGAARTTIVRHGVEPGLESALLLAEGDNSISGLKFADRRQFSSFADSRPVIRLGHRWDDPRVQTGRLQEEVRRVVISHNLFRGVGIPVIDNGLPIEQLYITYNDFGGYARGLELPGDRQNVNNPFRIDDAVIRWNRFVPGSYTDLSARQGVIATGLGASHRVDFSANEADGTSTEALQGPADPRGWRAAFFWNMNNNIEELLVADNRVSCSGDKAGDGEAISFDANGNTFGYPKAEQVIAAAVDSVSLASRPAAVQSNKSIDPGRYYVGHWIQVVGGPGLGQTRKIREYSIDPRGTGGRFAVAPRWDVIPVAGQTSVIVARQFWQTYVVGNEITQAAPPCRKSNLTRPSGGEINLWAPSADSVIDGNRQFDTSGVGFTQGYSVRTPSCPTCDGHATLQSALEIRDNLIDGEYDWESDCSLSGVHGTFGASPTPEAPPPIMSVGVQIIGNVISHADGLRGGAIDIVPTWFTGPESARRPLIDNLIVAHNVIRDLQGGAPRASCRYGQHARTGIHIEGTTVVQGTVLYNNTCERVDSLLSDSGSDTLRICRGTSTNICECGSVVR